MNALDQAKILFRSGSETEAVAHVEAAAGAGDTEALLALAHWRLFGQYGPADPVRAQALLGQAGEAGSAEARRLLATLVGNGTGSPSDPERARLMLESLAAADPASARELAFLDAMPGEEEADRRTVDRLCEDPPIALVRALLLPGECDYLMEQARPLLQPSFVIDPRTGARIPHPIRTSSGMNFGPTQEDLVIHRLNRRIAAASATQVECGEPLHILRYTPGQQYSPHVDAIPGADNQRSWTVLVYLNGGYGGGETRFDLLGITAKGRQGDALVFRNVTAEGLGDPRTRHAGLPVTEGIKWLATRWIRQRPFDPLEPGQSET